MGRWGGSFGTCCRVPWWMGCMKVVQYRKPNWKSVFWGAFHSTQNSGNFGWFIKWNGPFLFGPTGIFGTSFEGGPLWPVWSFRSVGPKCPFPFAKIDIPSTALFYPAYKNKYFPVESEVLWVKHDISNSLNQLQFFSIFDIAINSVK